MSDPESWLELKDLFARAIDLDIENRAALLDRVRIESPELGEELAALLEAYDRTTHFLEQPAIDSQSMKRAAGGKRIAKVGRYSLEEVVGSGGMSTVYEAVHDGTEQAVCVKMMRLGLPGVDTAWSQRRFLLEAKVLGRLQHPNIARVHDTGTYELGGESIPYFVLERVRGARDIVRYCDDYGLSTSDRLHMFIDVCDAIHHGHMNGVVHRDIKPGNILVDESSVVKVIDFGVARVLDEGVEATEHRTGTGIVLGTLRYMSPEQLASAGGHVDARSDVYSLGVVLYELLTGAFPYELEGLTLYQMADVIRNSPATPPGRIRRALKGDVESILLRTLAKERTSRYDSAASLRDDIRRYLANEPIQARPPSTVYQLRKLVARHKATAFLIVAVVVVSVVFGVAMSLQSMDLRQQRDLADREATSARAARDVLLSFVSAGGPVSRSGSVELVESPGKELTLRELVIREGDRVIEELEAQPVLQAEVLSAFGAVLADHAEYDRAADYLERAIEIKRRELGGAHEATLEAMDHLASVYRFSSRSTEARSIVDRALVSIRESRDADEVAELPFLRTLANIEVSDLDLAKARLHLEDALDILDRAEVPDDVRAWIWHDLGFIELSADRTAEAEVALDRALTLMSDTYGREHLNTSLVLGLLSRLCVDQEKFDDAYEHANRALEIHRALLDEDHPLVSGSLRTLGSICLWNLEYERADQFLSEAVRLGRERGEETENSVGLQLQLATARRTLGRIDEAEELLRDALRAFEEHPEWAKSSRIAIASELATTLMFRKKDLDEAERLYLETAEAARDNQQYRLLSVRLLGLAHVCVLQGRIEAAAQHLRESFLVRGKHVGDFGVRPYVDALLITLHYTATHPDLLDLIMEQPYTAEAFAAAADEWSQMETANRKLLIHQAFLNRLAGEEYAAKGMAAQGVPYLRVATDIYRDIAPVEESPHYYGTRARLGSVLGEAGEHEEAEVLLLEAHRELTRVWGARHDHTNECTRRLAEFYKDLGETEKSNAYAKILEGGTDVETGK